MSFVSDQSFTLFKEWIEALVPIVEEIREECKQEQTLDFWTYLKSIQRLNAKLAMVQGTYKEGILEVLKYLGANTNSLEEKLDNPFELIEEIEAEFTTIETTKIRELNAMLVARLACSGVERELVKLTLDAFIDFVEWGITKLDYTVLVDAIRMISEDLTPNEEDFEKLMGYALASLGIAKKMRDLEPKSFETLLVEIARDVIKGGSGWSNVSVSVQFKIPPIIIIPLVVALPVTDSAESIDEGQISPQQLEVIVFIWRFVVERLSKVIQTIDNFL